MAFVVAPSENTKEWVAWRLKWATPIPPMTIQIPAQIMVLAEFGGKTLPLSQGVHTLVSAAETFKSLHPGLRPTVTNLKLTAFHASPSTEGTFGFAMDGLSASGWTNQRIRIRGSYRIRVLSPENVYRHFGLIEKEFLALNDVFEALRPKWTEVLKKTLGQFAKEYGYVDLTMHPERFKDAAIKAAEIPLYPLGLQVVDLTIVGLDKAATI